MSLWENESQLDFHRTIKCSNHDVSDCWSGLTWMPNELYFWPRRNFSVGMVSFWYRFYKSKNGGLTRFGWAPTWRPQTQIFLHYFVQTYLRAQKVSFFLATVSFFYKNVLRRHIFIMSILLSSFFFLFILFFYDWKKYYYFVLFFWYLFQFPTWLIFEHPGYSLMSLWENESQLDLHRTTKCSNHDVSDCWSGLTWMANEF